MRVTRRGLSTLWPAMRCGWEGGVCPSFTVKYKCDQATFLRTNMSDCEPTSSKTRGDDEELVAEASSFWQHAKQLQSHEAFSALFVLPDGAPWHYIVDWPIHGQVMSSTKQEVYHKCMSQVLPVIAETMKMFDRTPHLCRTETAQLLLPSGTCCVRFLSRTSSGTSATCTRSPTLSRAPCRPMSCKNISQGCLQWRCRCGVPTACAYSGRRFVK